MDNKIVIIKSMFNVKPYINSVWERYTKEWIDYRLDVFQNFTRKSLELQTNQKFFFVACYDDCTDDIIKASLNRYDPLPSNVKFIRLGEYEEELKNLVKDFDEVYFVRLDSDDAYHKTYIQQLYDLKPDPNTVALISRNGYLYDSVNKQLAKCYCKVVTFYTFMYKVKDYLAGNIHHPNFTDIDTEQYVALKVPHQFMEDRNYLWHVHSSNTITSFGSWFTELSDTTTNLETIDNIVSEYIGQS